VLSGAPDNALAESESTLHSSRAVWEYPEVLGSTGEVARSVWEGCLLLPDQFTFCRCRDGQLTHPKLSKAQFLMMIFRESSRPGRIRSSHLVPTLLKLDVEGTRGQIFAASPIALQSASVYSMNQF